MFTKSTERIGSQKLIRRLRLIIENKKDNLWCILPLIICISGTILFLKRNEFDSNSFGITITITIITIYFILLIISNFNEIKRKLILNDQEIKDENNSKNSKRVLKEITGGDYF